MTATHSTSTPRNSKDWWASTTNPCCSSGLKLNGLQQGLVGINHLKSRKKCTFKFMVESDSLEGAYCYGMDMLEFTCRVSKLGQHGPDVTDLKRPIRKMDVDDSADGEKPFINDSDKEDTVMKYSQTAKRMLR